MSPVRQAALAATCATAAGVLLLLRRERPERSLYAGEGFPWHTYDARDIASLVSCCLLSALATSAGIGGGPFFVPLLNIVAGLTLKDSVAVSQAAVAGGSLAGVVCGLLAQALSSSGLGADFGLALQYGPLLFLGTSGGVVLTLAVPNWVIVALLAVMMSLTAWRSLQKGAQLYRAEAQQMKAQAAPAVDDAGEGPEVPFASPFQSQAKQRPTSPNPADALASFPLDLDEMLSLRSLSGQLSNPQSPQPSEELAPSPKGAQTSAGHSRAGHQPSPLGQAGRQAPEAEQQEQLPALLDQLQNGEPQEGAQEAGHSAQASRRGTSPAVAFLQLLLLAGMLAGFGALQVFKSGYHTCTKTFGLIYGAQAGLCVLVSALSLGLLGRYRLPVTDAEAPLLRQQSKTHSSLPRPVAALATLVGGVAAGMTGLGGGQIIAPLFLEIGAPPQSAAATSLLLVLLNSASAVFQFMLAGHLDQETALVYFVLCFLTSCLGYVVMARLITATGHASFLVLVLGSLLSAGGLAVVGLGIDQVARHIRQSGGLPGFQSICN